MHKQPYPICRLADSVCVCVCACYFTPVASPLIPSCTRRNMKPLGCWGPPRPLMSIH